MRIAVAAKFLKKPMARASLPSCLFPNLVRCGLFLGAGLFLFAVGCSRSKSEPKITGKPSDPAASLHCAWKPGYRYHLRLEMEVLTEAGLPDPNETGLHRVTFAQDCLITATNVGKGNNIGLDMEVLSLAMERAKGHAVALSFDSEQGGEATDDLGYVPVLTNLIGGHLRFLLSQDGKMLRAVGLNEWLDHGLGGPPPRKAQKVAAKSPGSTNAPASASPQRATVSNTLRNFFTTDHFRQMLEFTFLPAAPVKVHEEWKNEGDTHVNGHGRFKFDASSRFAGWQQHGQTNCARIDVHGKLLGPGAASGTNASPRPDTLHAAIWIEPGLGFPLTATLNTEVPGPDPVPARKQGTNNVAVKNPQKSVRQNLSITLLEAKPIEIPRVESEEPAR